MMRLQVLLPSDVVLDEDGVSRIVAETSTGSLGLLPHRLDCVATLVPGVLVFSKQDGGEVFVAIDEGMLVKIGARVTVAVRRAVLGTDLAQLHALVLDQFVRLDAQRLQLHAAMARAESSFIRGLARYEQS